MISFVSLNASTIAELDASFSYKQNKMNHKISHPTKNIFSVVEVPAVDKRN